jgi:urate oxidase
VTPIALDSANYGKSAVRLVAVTRGGDRHELRDLTVDIALEDDFTAAHVLGDNDGLVATDTMRNAAYVLAKEQGIADPECFGMALGRYFLGVAPLVSRATVRVVEHPWKRLSSAGEPHDHAFERGAGGDRVACVVVDRDGVRVEAGIQKLSVLRTTGSGWSGFLRDRCATLADTDERVFATTIKALWSYRDAEVDFDVLWHGVRTTITDTFADHYSPSVQFTLRRMGEAVLQAHEPIEQIRLSLPNQHHHRFDLLPFGLENDNEIFFATTEPYGLIEGTIARTEAP